MIRTALAYLAAGFLIGALLLIQKAAPLGTRLPPLIPLHIEYLLLGCLVQLALGMAFWILPRFRSGPERGREAPAWVAFALLNLGVQAVAIGSLTGAPSPVGLLGRGAEGLALAAFALHAWPRVKASSPPESEPHGRRCTPGSSSVARSRDQTPDRGG